jgi:hypothetical protein
LGLELEPELEQERGLELELELEQGRGLELELELEKAETPCSARLELELELEKAETPCSARLSQDSSNGCKTEYLDSDTGKQDMVVIDRPGDFWRSTLLTLWKGEVPQDG